MPQKDVNNDKYKELEDKTNTKKYKHIMINCVMCIVLMIQYYYRKILLN